MREQLSETKFYGENFLPQSENAIRRTILKKDFDEITVKWANPKSDFAEITVK